MKENIIDYAINGFQYILCVLGCAENIEQSLRITLLCLSLLSTLIILIPKLIRKLKDWYHRAKKDGKISKEEIKEGIEILQDSANEIKQEIEDKIGKE